MSNINISAALSAPVATAPSAKSTEIMFVSATEHGSAPLSGDAVHPMVIIAGAAIMLVAILFHIRWVTQKRENAQRSRIQRILLVRLWR
ncbi:MAG: hypothetical protein WCX61_04900 [Candidatus Peribacteraceae bacterium]